MSPGVAFPAFPFPSLASVTRMENRYNLLSFKQQYKGSAEDAYVLGDLKPHVIPK